MRPAPSDHAVARIEPGQRIWLHIGGVRMFGPGSYDLLCRVEVTGSLHKAAKSMGMSYTKAWNLLRQTEERLGERLIERHIGGTCGGGSSLTAIGQELVRRYGALLSETDEAMRAAFDDAFADWPPSPSGGVVGAP